MKVIVFEFFLALMPFTLAAETMGLEKVASYACGILPEQEIIAKQNFSSTCWPILFAISDLELGNAVGQDEDTLVLFAAKVPSGDLECL